MQPRFFASPDEFRAWLEANRYVESGQKTGNVVLRVSEAAIGEQPEPAAAHQGEVPA